MGNEFDTLLFNLDPTLEPNLILESRLDLNQLPDSILVLVSFTLEFKSIISSNHISLSDQGVEQYNSEMVYQDWSFNRDECHDRILHDPIQFGGYNNVNRLEVKGGFLRLPYSLDWAVTLTSIRPPLEPPP